MASPDEAPRSSAAEIVFRNVTKRYPGRQTAAVNDLSLVVPAGEICVLVGPSGGGKTTAMKMVNRLIEINEGDILLDGQSVRSLDVIELRRRIGYVIQHGGLFPHMNVADNIATGPRLHRKVRKTVIFVTHDIDEAIKMGDRIAILREGGVLAQYDTPDAILANPADDFVARFVGADRSLKRLALKRLSDIELLAAPNGDASSYRSVP